MGCGEQTVSNYKRAYMVGEDFGCLLEERRGDEVRGSDQGYIEAEWKIKYISEKGFCENVSYVTEYRANFVWSNGGPANQEWFGESDFDDEDFMSDEWLAAHGWEVITDSVEIWAFIDSRPGLSEHMGCFMNEEGV